MSGKGCRGRPRRAIPRAFERAAVPEGVEHAIGSTTTSMNQPPAAGQAGPFGPPEGAQVPGMFTAEQVAQIAQIVVIATCQQPQPQPPSLPLREVPEESRMSIERAQKLDAKPYDGSGDPEVAWLWLDRVNKIYKVMVCTNDQRVLFLGFLTEDKGKDWWDVADRRYPDGMSWDQFQQEFTDRFFP